jgi:anti-sigma B factor antagonist
MLTMVETLEVKDLIVVRLVGDSLDASNAGSFRAVMAPLLDEGRDIVLQMSDVRFFDSSGLGAILHCLKRLHNSGRTLSLIGVNKAVKSFLELLRVHNLFCVCTTEADPSKALDLDEMEIAGMREAQVRIRNNATV